MVDTGTFERKRNLTNLQSEKLRIWRAAFRDWWRAEKFSASSIERNRAQHALYEAGIELYDSFLT